MNRIPRDVRKKLQSSAAQIDPEFKAELKTQLFHKEDTMAKKQSPVNNFVRFVRTTPALAVLAAIVIVGTTSALVATNRANVARDQEIEVPANLDDLLRTIAEADSGGASITGIELEKEDEGLLYKVKFSDGSIRYYDAKTGDAVNPKSENDDDEVPASSFSGGNSLAEARQIAAHERPGKTITKIELENEEGVVVYSVRFSDGGRVDVSAETGNVLRVRGASNSGSGSSRSSDDDDHDDDRSGSNSGSSHDDDDDDDRSVSNSGSGSSRDDDKDDDHSGSGKDD